MRADHPSPGCQQFDLHLVDDLAFAAVQYPVHLGEFGAFEKADMDSRAAYTRLVRDEAERRGIGWTYWNFSSDFGAYSTKTNSWIEPIRRALLE